MKGAWRITHRRTVRHRSAALKKDARHERRSDS